MAADPQAASVAKMLNDLSLIGMSNIAESSELTDLITEYFDTSNNGDDHDDDDYYNSSEKEEETEVAEASFLPHPPVPAADSDAGESIPTQTMTVSFQGTGDGDFENDGDDDAHGVNFFEDISATIIPSIQSTPTSSEKANECQCKKFEGKQCYTAFHNAEIDDARLCHIEMTREELDVCILSKLSVGMQIMKKSRHARTEMERKKTRTLFYFHGFEICRNFFRYLHNISGKKLNTLISHYRKSGIEARIHKSIKKAPKHALSLRDINAVVDFIVNFAEVHAIMLPGRQPGHSNLNVKLLPTNVTKKSVFNAYCESATVSDIHIVGVRSFYRLWEQLTPFVSTMRPATDLCWYCQKNSVYLLRSANLPDEQKSQAALAIQVHLDKASKERDYYRQVCLESRENLPAGVTLGQKDRAACSFEGMMHYSFDFAQQVHYPSNPLQPGPIFFKTPRKCGLFGVSCEALPCQVNFLLEECVSAGKGANCVVSLLHFFLEKFSVGEQHAHFHADNCSGQNKNNCMMQYLMWRVLTGRHVSIKMSFLLTGHTKFSCDWMFGLVKKRYKVTKVDCLEDIAKVVNESSTCNVSQLCGTEDGEVLVPVYDWTRFLGKFFRKIKAIKKFHHFHFLGDSGSVVCKEFLDSEPEVHNLLLKESPGDDMPTVISPPGLDLARQWYLYEEIRPFVAEEMKDRVTPKPLSPKPTSARVSEHLDIVEEEGPSAAKVRKQTKGKGKGKGNVKGKGKGK